MASVLVAETRPAATLLIWRSLPTAPTLTTPVGVAPANPLYVCPPTVALAVATAAAVTALFPSATLFATVAEAKFPIAILLVPAADTDAASPSATLSEPNALEFHPSAVAFAPVAVAEGPIAMEF